MVEVAPSMPVEHMPPETPVDFSPKTITAAEGVMKAMAQQTPVSKEDAQHLVDGVAQDVLKKDASAIPATELEAAKKSVVDTLTQSDAKQPLKEEPEEKIDLQEYASTLNYVGKIYGFDQKRGKLAAMETAMILPRFMGTLSTIGMQMMMDRTMHPDKLLQTLSAPMENWGQRAKVMWKAGWPLLTPIISMFPLLGLDSFARKQFAKEMLSTRDAINNRIANSIFMRDFEFIHDKSPAEIMNVIAKGKQATLSLLGTTYQDMIPSIAQTAFSVAPMVRENFVGAALGLLKLPIAAKVTEQMTLDYMRQRKQDLLKKDFIDTRILTSLSGLDVVKTSDSMENAIHDLEKMMLAQDTLQKDVEVQGIKREQKREQTMALLDLGIPIVTLGWDVLKDNVKLPLKRRTSTDLALPHSDTDDRPKKSIVNYGVNFMSMYNSQATMSSLSQHIGRLYAERIQPAIQDIKRMEELLGPVDQIDRPEGARELARVPVSSLQNFDIHVSNLQFKHILHGVSMDISQGSFVTIKGPSGIGKTTFFRHLVGLYGAENGAITYGGTDLQGIKKFGNESIYSKIAYANQNPQYFEDLTLRENLQLWTQKPATDAQISHVLHDLNLDAISDRLDSKVKHFSGGELRRIGIARALLKDPRVLYLDEPTANLDAESSRQVLEIIKNMRKTRPDMTVVAVTHDPDFEKIAEKIVDFRDINKPQEAGAVTLGDHQAFYGASSSGAA